MCFINIGMKLFIISVLYVRVDGLLLSSINYRKGFLKIHRKSEQTVVLKLDNVISIQLALSCI